MSRGLRIAALAAASLFGVVVLVFALAWVLMPRDWIERQALRQASQTKGVAVQWKWITPAFDGLAIGIKLEGLSVRIPATGEVKTDARTNAICSAVGR